MSHWPQMRAVVNVCCSKWALKNTPISSEFTTKPFCVFSLHSGCDQRRPRQAATPLDDALGQSARLRRRRHRVLGQPEDAAAHAQWVLRAHAAAAEQQQHAAVAKIGDAATQTVPWDQFHLAQPLAAIVRLQQQRHPHRRHPLSAASHAAMGLRLHARGAAADYH